MPRIKRYSVDAEHFIRFHVWTENFCCVFKFIRHSVDEALVSEPRPQNIFCQRLTGMDCCFCLSSKMILWFSSQRNVTILLFLFYNVNIGNMIPLFLS